MIPEKRKPETKKKHAFFCHLKDRCIGKTPDKSSSCVLSRNPVEKREPQPVIDSSVLMDIVSDSIPEENPE